MDTRSKKSDLVMVHHRPQKTARAIIPGVRDVSDERRKERYDTRPAL